MNYQNQYTSSNTKSYTSFNNYPPVYSQIPPQGPPPRDLPAPQLLKQQHYLKLFLHQLQTSTNLPTLSDPELLEKILKENEIMETQLLQIRGGKREQYLQGKLLQLSKEAEGMMQQMREFKMTREREKAELRRLERGE